MIEYYLISLILTLIFLFFNLNIIKKILKNWIPNYYYRMFIILLVFFVIVYILEIIFF